MARTAKPLAPWAQDQRRIRRLRAKVHAQYDRAESWMQTSDRGWEAARKLFTALRPHLTTEQAAEWDRYFEDNEPF
jgi:hypothetical protein